MHLGLILPSFSTNSRLQIPSLALLAAGIATKIDVTVIPLRNPPGIEHSHSGGVDVLDPGGASMRFRNVARQAIDLIRERHRTRPFDLLHAYWLFEPGAVAIAAGRLLSVPVVVSVGGAELISLPEIGYGGLRSGRGRLLYSAVLRSASLVTGGSGYVLDLARSHTRSAAPRMCLAPLPVKRATDASPGASPYPADSAPNLLQVGAYLPVKGQDLAIRALAGLRRERPDLHLTIIGEDPHGYRGRMQSLATNLGLGDRLRLLGRVPHNELDGYYRHADLLLMPSRHESQGMVVLEAATRGLPTVGSDVGVVRDLAPDSAVAVPTGDVRALERATARILNDGDRRAGIGACARRVVDEHYSLEPVIKQWFDLYEGVAGGG